MTRAWEKEEQFCWVNPVAIRLGCFTGAPTSAEQTAADQGSANAAAAAAEATQMSQMFTQQFGEQQGLLNNFLIPQLEGMISNPQGFGSQAIADMQANLVNTTAAQAANATQGTQQQFDTQNMAGLPSGVQQAIKAQIASAAGNTVAQGSNQIQLANAQEKLQQQQFGYQGLANAETALGAAPQTGQLTIGAENAATGANQNSFGQAQALYQQQQSSMLNGVLGGVLNAGLGFATGGLSSLLGGGNALGAFTGGMFGGQSAPALSSPGYMTNAPFNPVAPTGPSGVFGSVPS